MSKTNGAVPKGPTHFDTVPLEVVKAIAVTDVPMDQISVARDAIVEPVKKQLLIAVPIRPPTGKKQ
jgi:hypothetical protein